MRMQCGEGGECAIMTEVMTGYVFGKDKSNSFNTAQSVYLHVSGITKVHNVRKRSHFNTCCYRQALFSDTNVECLRGSTVKEGSTLRSN